MRPKSKNELNSTKIGLLGKIIRDLGKMSHTFENLGNLITLS